MQVFVTAPHAGIKEERSFNAVLFFEFELIGFVFDRAEVGVHSFIYDFYFGWVGVEDFLNVFLGVLADSYHFFSIFDRGRDRLFIGMTEKAGGHLLSWIKGKGQVMNGDHGWVFKEDRCVEMGEMHEIQFVFAKEEEEFDLF